MGSLGDAPRLGGGRGEVCSELLPLGGPSRPQAALGVLSVRGLRKPCR
jgi:hypothetical protein